MDARSRCLPVRMHRRNLLCRCAPAPNRTRMRDAKRTCRYRPYSLRVGLPVPPPSVTRRPREDDVSPSHGLRGQQLRLRQPEHGASRGFGCARHRVPPAPLWTAARDPARPDRCCRVHPDCATHRACRRRFRVSANRSARRARSFARDFAPLRDPLRSDRRARLARHALEDRAHACHDGADGHPDPADRKRI